MSRTKLSGPGESIVTEWVKWCNKLGPAWERVTKFKNMKLVIWSGIWSSRIVALTWGNTN